MSERFGDGPQIGSNDGGESPGNLVWSGKLRGQQVRKVGEGGRTARGVDGSIPWHLPRDFEAGRKLSRREREMLWDIRSDTGEFIIKVQAFDYEGVYGELPSAGSWTRHVHAPRGDFKCYEYECMHCALLAGLE